MGIQESCDFCGRSIAYHVTSNVLEPSGTVTIEEKKCDFCTEKSIKDGWYAELLNINIAWSEKERELKNFYKQQVRKKKEEFYITKAKLYFGSFYTPEIEQKIKDKINAA